MIETPALANDKYRATLRSTWIYDPADTDIQVDAIPANLPTIITVGWETQYETVFRVTGASGENSSNYALTGVTRIKGFEGNLPEGLTVNCLNNEEYFNQWGDQIAAVQEIVSATQPSAELQLPSSTSVPNSTETVISFDAVWDTHGFYDNSVSNSRITIPSGLGGRYLIVVKVEWAGSNNGARRVWLAADGKTATKFDFVNDGDAGVFGVDTKNYSMIMELSAGSYYELKLWQDSGGDLGVNKLFWEIYKLP